MHREAVPKTAANRKGVDFDYEISAINGREYPETERLTYPVGTLVHWRVINTSWADHPLHLHGFYYSVDSRGDGLHHEVAPENAYHALRVTELVPSGTTETLTWRASRAGNWLFHCHIAFHTAARPRDRTADRARARSAGGCQSHQPPSKTATTTAFR